jgi:hypothetical protein
MDDRQPLGKRPKRLRVVEAWAWTLLLGVALAP